MPTEYFNYNIIFSIENTAKLLKYTKINDYAIELKEDKQSLFRLIYSLKPIVLEILKTYIKINLTNGFIQPFKFSARALILFN